MIPANQILQKRLWHQLQPCKTFGHLYQSEEEWDHIKLHYEGSIKTDKQKCFVCVWLQQIGNSPILLSIQLTNGAFLQSESRPVWHSQGRSLQFPAPYKSTLWQSTQCLASFSILHFQTFTAYDLLFLTPLRKSTSGWPLIILWRCSSNKTDSWQPSSYLALACTTLFFNSC